MTDAVPTRYALVGVSGRSRMYTEAILGPYAPSTRLVALLDRNPERIKYFNTKHGLSIPAFEGDEFHRMIAESKPDAVIICTSDGTHADYLVQAMEAGIKAVCEKPIAVDESQIQSILEAESRSPAAITICHNYRYNPVMTLLRERILRGDIGRPTQVDFNYYLDTFHGASYFKRWNRYEKDGGSLLVTKACHHFDLVNWLTGLRPLEVFARGRLNYYGPDGPANPSKKEGRRCSTCEERCRYFTYYAEKGDSYLESLININNPGKNDSFARGDGYFADRCIFDSDIDTWDTFSLSALYENGLLLHDLFVGPDPGQPVKRTAGSREGAIAALVGIAARRSLKSGCPVQISDLIDPALL